MLKAIRQIKKDKCLNKDNSFCDVTEDTSEDDCYDEDLIFSGDDSLTCLFDSYHEKHRRLHFADELLDCRRRNSIIVEPNERRNTSGLKFLNFVKKNKDKKFCTAKYNRNNYRKSKYRIEKAPEDVLEILETTSLLSMMSDCPEEESGLYYSNEKICKRRSSDADEVDCTKISNEMNKLLKSGDDSASKLEYTKAIKSYMQVIKKLKKSLMDDYPIMDCVMKRLKDTHHKISLIRTSTDVLKMGLDDENNDMNLKSLKYYTVAYRMRRSVLGENHISLAIILFMIARVQAKREEYDESLQIYEMCLRLIRLNKASVRIEESRLPKICIQNNDHTLYDPPELSVLLRDVGAVHEKKGNFHKALEHYDESLELHLKNNNTIANRQGTNEILEELMFDTTKNNSPGDQEETQAMEVFMKSSSTKVYNYRFKKDDINSAMTLHSIGQIHRRLGQYTLALQAYNRALNCMKKTMGDKHPNVAAMLANIGNLHKDKGDYDNAFRIYQKVLRIEMTSLGPNHPEIAVTLNNIAAIECCRGKHIEAIGLLQRVFKIQKSYYEGTFNVAIAITLTSIGDVFEKLSRIDEAIKSYEAAAQIFIRYFDNESMEIAKLLKNIAILYYERKDDLTRADTFITKAVKMFDRVQQDDGNTPEFDSNMKQALSYLADIKAAIALSRSDAWSLPSSESIDYSSV